MNSKLQKQLDELEAEREAEREKLLNSEKSVKPRVKRSVVRRRFKP
jgi:hypothetical protein